MRLDQVQKAFLQVGQRLGRADILFWTLPYLMVLVILGTVLQKFIGLYAAQSMVFSSFFFVWKGIPFFGGYSVLSLMAVNMTCKLVFLSRWTMDKLGVHVAHLSIVILFVGGLLTAFSMEDGFMTLKIGETQTTIRDYHKRVLFLTKEGNTIAIPFTNVKSYDFGSLPFDVEIIEQCDNSAIRPHETPDPTGIGAASMADLVCVEKAKESERNVAGFTYRVTNAEIPEENGTYIVFEGRQTQDDVAGYEIRLDREIRTLPFALTLQSFFRDVYPGTNMPRDYTSRLIVKDGDVEWPAVISMNEPLRYGGYTLYQSSTWIDRDGQAVSVLNIVKNGGWIFPYISGVLLAIGLLYHTIRKTKKMRGRKS